MTVSEDELHPGAPCPVCGDNMVTWFAEQVSNVNNVERDGCWLDVDDVESTSPGSFPGNILVIDHDGPTMEQ